VDFKNIFKKILFSILGIIIIGSISNFIIIIILTFYFIIVKPNLINNWLLILNSLIGLLNIILGIYFGLRFHKSKNIWYIIFKPIKNKIIISLSLSLIFVIFILLISEGKSFLNTYTLMPMSQIIGIPLSIVSYFIAFYPFSAICNFIYHYKKKKLFKEIQIMVIILLIILNPVSILFAGSMGIVYKHKIMNEPCGAKIIAFTQPSAAQESGMHVDEIIIKINEKKIDSVKSLKEYMDDYNPPTDLLINTDKKIYTFNPYFQNETYLLGVYLSQEYCKRSLI
jgi:hypothetical protein